ncbi:hypothetical protein NIB75_02180 [Bacteroides uniformis]|nr:hypothetical protein [Bacteroides uniformis]
MSYITEAINKWGKCRTGAITMYGAGVGVYGNSGYAYTGSTPSKLKKRIEEANSSNAEITDINITENGNYVIILGGSVVLDSWLSGCIPQKTGTISYRRFKRRQYSFGLLQ